MKTYLLGFLLLITISGWSASIQEFASLSDFRMAGKNDSQLTMLPWPGTEAKKVSCQFPPAENPGAVQIVCEWNAARHHPLPQTPFLLQLEVHHTEPQPFSRLVLRLCDIKGEVFQFCPVKQLKGPNGLLTQIYEISDGKFSGSWGSNVDRKFDFPLYFAGVAFDRSRNTPGGTVIFNQLLLQTPAEASVVSKLPLLIFDPDRNSCPAAFQNGSGEVELTGKALRISGNASGVTIGPYCWKEVVRPVPEAIRVTLDVRKGEGRITVRRENGAAASAVWKGIGEKTVEIPFPETKDTEGIFQNFSLDFPQKEPFDLTITGMDLVTRRSPAASLDCDVETGSPLHVLKTGDENKLRLVFRNPSESPLSWQVKTEFRDFNGEGFLVDHRISLAPGEEKSFPVEPGLSSRGIWNVRFQVTGEKGGTQETYRSFAYMADQPEKTGRPASDQFLFGMCDHPFFFSKRDYRLMLDTLTLAGVELFRTDAFWDGIQPEENVWNFQRLDRVVTDLRERGIELNLILHPVPRWAVPPDRRDKGYGIYSRSRPVPGIYEKSSCEIAKHYQGKVRYWEIWNECDLISASTLTAAEYTDLLKEGFRGIRKGDPDALVMTCGFASCSNPRGQQQFQKTVLKDAKGFYDVHAFHQHGGFSEFASVIDNQLLPLRKSAGATTPWFANESALTSVVGTEREQAIAVFKRILFAWSRGSISYIWYNLINKGFDPFDGEHNYGIFTHDFYPKPAFSAYAELSRLYSGLKFDRQLKTIPGQYLFQFSGKNRIVLGGWNETGGIPTVPLLFQTDAKQAFRIDLMGNRVPVPVQNHRVLFPVEEVPSSLLLEDAGQLETEGVLLSVNVPGAVIPGKSFPLEVTANNPFSSPENLRLDFLTPSGIRMDRTHADVSVLPGQKTVIPFTVETAGDFSRKAELRLNYRFQGMTGTLSIPLHPAIAISTRNPDSRPADLVIDNASHVYNLYQADPENESRNWKGPEDLSAKIWLAREGNSFRIKAEVTDDKQIQPFSGFGVFNGDGIQLALQLPGQTGLWEIGLSRLDSGKSEVFVWLAPAGFNADKTAAEIQLATSRKGNLTTYDARIPFEAIGLTPTMMRNGFRADFLINDNDGEGRNGWIYLAPGMGTDKNPAQFPFFVFPEPAR